MSLLSPIPAEKQEAVEKALQTAFSTSVVESIVPLTDGLSSALVCKIVVNSRPFVLRLVLQTNSFNDPARQYACMNAAAAAGIAPHVYYSDATDAISITDFIETVPRPQPLAASEEMLRELVRVIRTIHATPLFPKLVNHQDVIDGFIERFKASRLLPESATEEHFRYYAELQKVYPRDDSDVVSSHNDLNPNNLLFDGRKLWVIDWDTAFQNDRYTDLATAANYFAIEEVAEEVYLKAYFGDSLDDYKRARFFLKRQSCYLLGSLIFLDLASRSRTLDSVVDDSMDTPFFREFGAQIGAGVVSLASYEGQLMCGKVLMNEALRQMNTPRFAESLQQMP